MAVVMSFSTVCSYAQTSRYRLQIADSLFEARQYTQSLEHYKNIFQNKQYSPAMLLKMAFIEEGLHQTGEALYYLNLYYLATKDESVLQKMETMATKFNLEGYQVSENDRALSMYRDLAKPIALGLSVIIFFLLSLSIFLKRRKQNPVATVVIMLIFVVLLAVHINFSGAVQQGIVVQNNVYLMRGPSAAAGVAEVIGAGHRVTVKGKQDVWVQIEWDGGSAFIRENLLLPVAL